MDFGGGNWGHNSYFWVPSTCSFQKREWISFRVAENNIHQKWKLQRCRFLLNTRNGVLPLEMFSLKNWAAFLHNDICIIWMASRGCISFVGDAHRPLEGQDGLCLGTQAPKQQLWSSSMHTNHRRTWGTPRYLPPRLLRPTIRIELVGCGDQGSALLRSSWVMLMKPPRNVHWLVIPWRALCRPSPLYAHLYRGQCLWAERLCPPPA